jgi:phosphomevalonate kinase
LNNQSYKMKNIKLKENKDGEKYFEINLTSPIKVVITDDENQFAESLSEKDADAYANAWLKAITGQNNDERAATEFLKESKFEIIQ